VEVWLEEPVSVGELVREENYETMLRQVRGEELGSDPGCSGGSGSPPGDGWVD